MIWSVGSAGKLVGHNVDHSQTTETNNLINIVCQGKWTLSVL